MHNLKRKTVDEPTDHFLEKCGANGDVSESDAIDESNAKRLKIDDDNECSQSSSSSTSSSAAAADASDTEGSPSVGRRVFLIEALRKIEELEEELAQLDDDDCDSGHHETDDIDEDYDSFGGEEEQIIDGHDAEAIGFAVCVREAFNFLSAEGIAPDDPLVLNLRERLIGQYNGLPFQ